MKKPLVFTDFHHASLLNSLIMLFENRLGGAVFRPIGLDWATGGFWKVYDHPATQEQFLGIGAATPDGSPKLNEVESQGGGFQITMDETKIVDESHYFWYNCKDIESDTTNKAITFKEFMKMPFDIIIASIPQHVEPFKRLAELHPNKPKVIFQIGNAWTSEAASAKNIMASANISGVPSDVHFISYHQEFDINVFCPMKWVGQYGVLTQDGSHAVGPEFPIEIMPSKNIYSFVNVFNGQSHFASDWGLFTGMERLMPEWNFKSYGGQCRDGSMDGSENLAYKMREARFIWHTKNGGDGYGHIIHNAAAVGKPMVVKKSYYAGKMGDKLLIDGETCINIDGLDPDAILQKIEYYSEPTRYAEMCRMTYQNFKEVCDFDKEFEGLQIFLNNLL